MKYWLPVALLVSASAVALSPPESNVAKQHSSDACLKAYEAGNYFDAVPRCERAAQRGNTQAQAVMGMMYFFGHGVVANNDTAARWLEQAAIGGSDMGQYYFGRLHSTGLGVEQNDVEAFNWYLLSAKQGYPLGQWTVSLTYRLGIGTPKDMDLAYEWYAQAQKQLTGLPEKNREDFEIQFFEVRDNIAGANSYKQALVYLLGLEGEPSPTNAFPLMLEAANQGHPDAQYQLGLMYVEGEGVSQDMHEAYGWFQLASENHHRDAQAYMGWMNLLGTGTPYNLDSAIQYYVLSLQPSKEALAAKEQQEVRASQKGTIEWYQLQARRGNTQAQTKLGLMYVHGDGVAQDYLQGYRWLQTAASSGDATAEYHLGMMYLEGQGIAQDPIKGIEWLKRAASHNEPNAQYEIGLLYYTGRFVTRDFPAAYAWFNISAGQDVLEAQTARTQIMNEMSQDQLASGQRLSRDIYKQLNQP